jgi:KaiC/GvpD/RAD55 family RecA-like ATPase
MIDLTPYKRDQHRIMDLIASVGSQHAFKGTACRCPFHDDKHASAGIFQADDGWKFKCQTCGAGGDYFDVKALLSGTTATQEIQAVQDGAKQPQATTAKKPITFATIGDAESGYLGKHEARYCYNDGYYIYRLKRDNSKYFQPLHWNGTEWQLSEKPGVQPLYNADGVKDAAVVLVVEGEKCVDALTAIGVPAVTTPFGAGATKSKQFDYSPLTGKTVYLWPDNDEVKNGESVGFAHMQRISLSLEALGIQAKMVDIAPLKLPIKGDVVDFLATLTGDTKAKKVALWKAMSGCKPTGARAELMEAVDEIERGEHTSIPIPWKGLHDLSRFTTPGQVTIMVGEPGAGKSFFLIECAAHWVDTGIPFAFYALEDPRSFHIRRALAQRSSISHLTDADWIKDHASSAREIMQEHSDFMDKLGAGLSGEPSEAITKDKLIEWIAEKISRGVKVIVIDPITMTRGKLKEKYLEDEALMDKVKVLASANKVSIVLATHPTKEDGEPSLNAISGGASVGRFAHKVIWLKHHINPIKSNIRTDMGNVEMEHNRTMHILKSRDTRGQGMRIAMNFDSDLKFYERGIILSKGAKEHRQASAFEQRAIDTNKPSPYRTEGEPIEETFNDDDDGIPY